jgi:hypothetical protein
MLGREGGFLRLVGIEHLVVDLRNLGRDEVEISQELDQLKQNRRPSGTTTPEQRQGSIVTTKSLRLKAVTSLPLRHHAELVQRQPARRSLPLMRADWPLKGRAESAAVRLGVAGGGSPATDQGLGVICQVLVNDRMEDVAGAFRVLAQLGIARLRTIYNPHDRSLRRPS